MESITGIIIGVLFMAFLWVQFVKETKTETWKWNAFTIGLTALYAVISLALIYQIIIRL